MYQEQTKFVDIFYVIVIFICLDKPFNPLVTSGGILSASLLLQLVKPEMDDLARKYEYVQNIFEVTFQIDFQQMHKGRLPHPNSHIHS